MHEQAGVRPTFGVSNITNGTMTQTTMKTGNAPNTTAAGVLRAAVFIFSFMMALASCSRDEVVAPSGTGQGIDDHGGNSGGNGTDDPPGDDHGGGN